MKPAIPIALVKDAPLSQLGEQLTVQLSCAIIKRTGVWFVDVRYITFASPLSPLETAVVFARDNVADVLAKGQSVVDQLCEVKVTFGKCYSGHAAAV